MDIFPVGSDAVAIYIDGEELTRIKPQGPITAADAAGILKNALGAGSGPRWDRACIELFPGSGGALLFAQIPKGAPRYFSFDCSEPLIRAAKASPRGEVSLLTLLDGRYILTVYPPDGDAGCAPLLEFGQPLDRPEGFAAYLSEHGRLLAGPRALDTFRDSF